MREKLIQKLEEVFGTKEKAAFQEETQSSEIRIFFAPGRVNLIGEHTDYNGGHVFPCALTIGTYAAVRKNGGKKLRFFSLNFEKLGVMEVSLGNYQYNELDNWVNYPKGVLQVMQEQGYPVLEGMDILYYGNIPNSSGLSSSASLEVLTGYFVKELYGYNIDMVQMALLCQKAENTFIGVNCGIMDQFSIAMGKKDHAIFLDTADLSYEYAPIKLSDAKIVIACSNKKRGLGDSKYNERRSQCEQALQYLQKAADIKNLGELTEKEFEEYSKVIPDPILIKRARHAVYENQRTIQAVAALKENRIEDFGELMNESHISLRDDYEVTGIELDTLVEQAWKQPGVLGSRMTGAGFGGCTVSIVKTDNIDSFIYEVGRNYKEKIGYKADFYVVEIGDGPVELCNN